MKTREAPLASEERYLDKLVDVVALSQKECLRPIQAYLVYATTENFVGNIIEGYTPDLTDFALLTREAGIALCKVQNDLIKQHDLGLLIFDTYRPKRAVLNFADWSKQPVAHNAQGHHELARKEIHYPHIEKNQLFDLGYVALDSQHCYGHTVDLVLIDKDCNELDLGACFDFMDTRSHLSATADEIGEKAFQYRQILIETMKKHGFLTYPYEFWHYSYKEKAIVEPMDFVITEELKGLNV